MESQNLLFTTVKKTLKHSFIYGLGNSFAVVVGVMLIPLYTRTLSPGEYGIYALITVVYTLLAFVYDLGMINALFRWVYQYKEDEIVLRKRVATTALVFLSIIASSLTVILWSNAAFVSGVIFNSSAQAGLIRLMLISLFLQSLTWVPLSFLRIKEKPLTLISIVISGMTVMVLLNYVFLSNGAGLQGIYTASIISYALILPAFFYFTRDCYAPVFSLLELAGMLRFGLVFFPVLFFSWIIDFSGRYFLGRYSSLEQVGLYSIGYKVGQVLYLAERTFAVAWLPLMLSLAQKYAEKAPLVFGRIMTYFIFVSAFLFLSASIFSKEIISVFTSASYYEAYKVVPPIAFSYFLYGIYIYMFSGLMITKKIYLQPVIFCCSAAVNVVLNVILIPKYNMMGAAYASLISYLLIAAATYYYSQKFYPIAIEFNRLLKIAAAVILVYSLSIPAVFPGLALSLISKTIMLAGFFLILYITGFFQKAELDRLRPIFLKYKKIT